MEADDIRKSVSGAEQGRKLDNDDYSK